MNHYQEPLRIKGQWPMRVLAVVMIVVYSIAIFAVEGTGWIIAQFRRLR